jgi:hypothetical protein
VRVNDEMIYSRESRREIPLKSIEVFNVTSTPTQCPQLSVEIGFCPQGNFGRSDRNMPGVIIVDASQARKWFNDYFRTPDVRAP